jgi:DNA-binding response OmpR family regulator
MAYDFSQLRVLVVEDNQPMSELIKSLLLIFGVDDVILARNGREGFDRFVLHNPDLVLADWMMREMDGIAMTNEIRTSATSPNQFVPIIMMTGFSEKHRVIEARDAGVTEFLVKPFTARDLYRRVEEIIERPRQFVRSEDFFGPDRRRRRDTGFEGPFRREIDRLQNLDRVVLFGDEHE